MCKTGGTSVSRHRLSDNNPVRKAMQLRLYQNRNSSRGTHRTRLHKYAADVEGRKQEKERR